MSKSISREQGDNNLTEKRKDYSFCLDEETQRWIERDGDCFLHQALSTLVMNMLSKTEGAYIPIYKENVTSICMAMCS